GFRAPFPVTVHRLLDRSRLVPGLATADQGGHDWRFSLEEPPGDWRQPDFDDSAWPTGKLSGKAPRMWLRTNFELPTNPAAMAVRYRCSKDIEIYANGKLLLQADGSPGDYRRQILSKSQLDLFAPGHNTLAVYARQTTSGQDTGTGIDIGISWIEIDPEDFE
ncbi:MAG: hypothetical protein V3V75_09850, partial [Thermoguttaceae bacterium]